MPAYKEFNSNNLVLRYMPDAKVIYLLPQKGIPSHYLNAIKSKIETFLPITSVKQEQGGISMKIDKNVAVPPEELFRSFGFVGGTDSEDAASVALKGAQNDLDQEQGQTQPGQQKSILGHPGGGNGPSGAPPQEPQPEQQNESLLFALFEEFWHPHKGRAKAFKRRPGTGKLHGGKRSGKYWKILERTLGKSKEKITEKDILVLRKKFGNQPFSQERNSKLRDLDRAYRYFLGKIKRERGENSKDAYKQQYLSQADLSPEDYMPGKHTKRLTGEAFESQNDYVQPPENPNRLSLNNLDLDMDHGLPGEDFGDIEIEDSENIPRL